MIDQGAYTDATKDASSLEEVERLYYLMKIAYNQSEFTKSHQFANQAIDKLANKEITHPRLYELHLYRVSAMLYGGEYEQAISMLEHYEKLEPLNDLVHQGFQLQIRGRIEFFCNGHLEKAKQLLEQSAEILEKVEEWFLLSMTLYHLCYTHSGEKMIELAEKATNIQKSLGNERLIGSFTCFTGHMNILNGEYNTARKLNRKALEIAERYNFRQGLGQGNYCLGLIAMEEGRLSEAINRFQVTDQVYWENFGVSNVSAPYLAMTYRLAGQLEKAYETSKSGLENFWKHRYMGYQTWTFIQYTLSMLDFDLLEEAEASLIRFQQSNPVDYTSNTADMIKLAHALILKKKQNLSTILKAQQLLKEVVDSPEPVWFHALIVAIRHLSEIMIMEYEMFLNDEILVDTEHLISRLSDIADREHLIRIRFESGVLQSKILILSGKIDDAQDLLQNLLDRANQLGLGHFVKTLDAELDEVNRNFQKWVNIIESNTSMKTLIEETKIKEYLTRASKFIDLEELN